MGTANYTPAALHTPKDYDYTAILGEIVEIVARVSAAEQGGVSS